MDPKVKNLLKFLVLRLSVLLALIYSFFTFFVPDGDLVRGVGYLFIIILLGRVILLLYRHQILPAKKPLEYGSWAIITGCTSGIGREFSFRLAREGMNLLLISRDESKLEALVKELDSLKLRKSYDYLVYDFAAYHNMPSRNEFYNERLLSKCKEINEESSIGLLVNNVGVANETPKLFEEFSEEGIDDMLYCNIFSTIHMTRYIVNGRIVFPFMKERKSGGIISISSGSCNFPGPFLALYSSTKAFMTQFSRSMHVECWGTGVDFLVVTPFYIVSNLYKRKSGTLVAPLPEKLVDGTLYQLGKQYVWQCHGYWFHGVLGTIGLYYWGAVENYRQMMLVMLPLNSQSDYCDHHTQRNRKRYEERQSLNSKKDL